jgi:hypothetical protein
VLKRAVRSECLDWLLILNHLHLERVLEVFVEHYNGHRPHRALPSRRPTRGPPMAPSMEWGEVRVQRRDRLGGDSRVRPGGVAKFLHLTGLELLEQAYERHDVILVFLKTRRHFDPLRDQPRFYRPLHRMDFPN